MERVRQVKCNEVPTCVIDWLTGASCQTIPAAATPVTGRSAAFALR